MPRVRNRPRVEYSQAVRTLAVILLAAIGVGGAVGGRAAAGSVRPALRLTDDTPITFRGTGFDSDEHVKVVTVAGKRAVHWVTAGAGGRFVVRFRGLDANACRGFAATAFGDRGSRATYKRAPGQCPAP
jgi:hypothetical protein